MASGFDNHGRLVPTVSPCKGWTSAEDGWKVKRKGSKVRMKNPAALMEGQAGLTMSVDTKTGDITFYDGHRPVMRVTQAQLDAILKED